MGKETTKLCKRDLGTFSGIKSSITSIWHFENRTKEYFVTGNFLKYRHTDIRAASWAVKANGTYRKDVINHLIVGWVKWIEENKRILTINPTMNLTIPQ